MEATTFTYYLLQTKLSYINIVKPAVYIYTYLLSFLTVHRIGRTGRCGKTGIATTFINKTCGGCRYCKGVGLTLFYR